MGAGHFPTSPPFTWDGSGKAGGVYERAEAEQTFLLLFLNLNFTSNIQTHYPCKKLKHSLG